MIMGKLYDYWMIQRFKITQVILIIRYRAKIKKVHNEKKSAEVIYIDHGNVNMIDNHSA